ncbi:MAG: cysteine desulfurase [Planctomycetales bacterium]|nr:cysteine desulfurase [Planctomycetales bacterium]
MPVYLDNHSTTRVDPRVVEAMQPCWLELYGNPGSTTHTFGHDAEQLVEQSRQRVAECLGVTSREIVFTSGATESNNLALLGVAERFTEPGHVLSVASEHKAVLDPLALLERRGWRRTLLPVAPQTSSGDVLPGQVDLQQFADAIEPDTRIATVMLANNEIGVLQPIAQLAAICRDQGVIFHCDATQAIGKLPLDLAQLGADLYSLSAHKLHGPKGIGALVIRRRTPRVRLRPRMVGGGQEGGLRSGTLNVPGIVGLAAALQLCVAELPEEQQRLADLRQRLWEGILLHVPSAELNGPPLQDNCRLPNNLNACFPGLDGEALMINMPELAVSSGSACTSTNPRPSHVLASLGLSDDRVRSSLRFGLGRFNTEQEVLLACDAIGAAARRLRSL